MPNTPTEARTIEANGGRSRVPVNAAGVEERAEALVAEAIPLYRDLGMHRYVDLAEGMLR